ncbi:hypothetical protein BB560_002255 [Smittium megazygosporum]|uniref:Peptidase S1 domain-containing protein n=2 Tax=Smittium megazygosporum TaxID=133381 RepID=A0A2T9ZF98_9FUNG|nr:hypothetical protein BB560_002255 [Smittium megazygosporum]
MSKNIICLIAKYFLVGIVLICGIVNSASLVDSHEIGLNQENNDYRYSFNLRSSIAKSRHSEDAEIVNYFASKGLKMKRRIIGGAYVASEKYGFVAMLQVKLGNGLFMCGGSLISNRFVLTAAHCVSPLKQTAPASNVTVGLGNNQMIKLSQTRALRIHVHPDWTPSIVKNDIALIEINPVSFSQELFPIPLSNASPTQAKTVYAVGWGRTSTTEIAISSMLKQATLITGNINLCTSLNPNAQRNPQALICTINNITRMDTCVGDSGGPLVGNAYATQPGTNKPSKNVLTLYGITSFGTNGYGQGDSRCSSDGSIGFYTNIAFHRNWIRSIAGN